MAEDLNVVGVGRDGTVVAVRVLRPGRIATMLRSRWVLEVPLDRPLPAVGEHMVVYAG